MSKPTLAEIRGKIVDMEDIIRRMQDGAETVFRLHEARGAPLERAVGWVGTSLMEQADELAQQWSDLDTMIKEIDPSPGAID